MEILCVFDDKCLCTYYKEDLKISGKVFTEDKRDPQSKLYPFSISEGRWLSR